MSSSIYISAMNFAYSKTSRVLAFVMYVQDNQTRTVEGRDVTAKSYGDSFEAYFIFTVPNCVLDTITLYGMDSENKETFRYTFKIPTLLSQGDYLFYVFSYIASREYTFSFR